MQLTKFIAWGCSTGVFLSLLQTTRKSNNTGYYSLFLCRDIKPGNFLIIGDVVKLSDFGLSKITEATIARVGTPFYMAPEVCLPSLFSSILSFSFFILSTTATVVCACGCSCVIKCSPHITQAYTRYLINLFILFLGSKTRTVWPNGRYLFLGQVHRRIRPWLF